MAEFKLGRIRFVWKNEWATSQPYYKDDVVRYGGRTYICAVGHTSAADFNTDLEFNPTKWNLMTDGTAWKGDWASNTFYAINDVVKYGGLLYICNDSHTSAANETLGLENNQSSWTLYAEGFDWKGSWTVSTRYKKNDQVKYGGYTYVCNTGHTSAATAALGLETNQSYWDSFNEGLEYKGTWQSTVLGQPLRYKVNDVVKYGAGLWVCTTQHSTQSTFAADSDKWSQFIEGFEFEDTWSSATTYQPGDVVRYGGNQYVSKTIHSNTNPRTSTSNWDLFTEGFKWASNWSISTSYKIGEVVRVNGHTYLADTDAPSASVTVTSSSATTDAYTTTDTTGMVVGMVVKFSGTTFGNVISDATYYVKTVAPTSFTLSLASGGATHQATTATGSMTAVFAPKPPNTSYWSRLNAGIQWMGTWSDDTEYVIGDAVRYGSNAFICVLAHRSEADDGSSIGATGGGAANSRPDQDTAGTYWNALSVGSDISVLTTKGDLVYFGGAGPARLPVGIEGQVLRVNANDEPEWTTLGATDQVYYVAPHGTDGPAPVHGLTLDKPFKTIRYACEQIEKGPRNPNAQRLLELNRPFIQREVSTWIRAQIAGNTAPFTTLFDYDEYKCERDVGYIVDRLIWDLGHGGNLKIRAAAQSLLGVLDEGPYSAAEEDRPYATLSAEKEEGVAAYNYMLTVVDAVLNSEAPAISYQTVLNDSTAIVAQHFIADVRETAEPGTMDTVTELVGIITTALSTLDSDTIPARLVPNTMLSIRTGRYRETLPIIVPAETALVGEELRSTNAGPAGSLIDLSDAKYSVNAYTRLETVVGQIVTGANVTETTGNTAVQSIAWPYATANEATSVKKLVRAIQHSVDYNLNTLLMSSTTDPTGYNVSFPAAGYGDARKLVKENKAFFQQQVKAWLTANYPTLKYSRTACLRDVGYIVDALVYDLTYGGNAMSVQAGLAYYEGVGSSLYIDSSEKTATLAAYAYLKSIIQTAAVASVVTSNQSEITQFTDSTAGSAGAATFIGNCLDEMIDIVNNGPAAATLTDPSTSWVSGALTTAYSTLSSASSTIAANTITYINTTYPTLVYNSTKCSRDVETIIKAVGYDFMFNSNFQTIKAAYAYLRATASEVFSLGQKAATRGALSYVATQALASVGGDTTAQARITSLMATLDDIIFAGSNEGSICSSEFRSVDNAILQLERNRDYIVAEIAAHITNTNKGTVTATTATSNLLTISDTSWLQRNTAIVFSGTVFGGNNVEAGTTYYVQQVVSSTTFKIATTRNSNTSIDLDTGTGSFAIALDYDATLCLRDINAIIDALKFDTKYPGNYKSLLAARYYYNAVTGSLEEDMFYCRNGTGIRNMTLEGLTGDLLPENAFGTSRVSAGAYVSLDPGWGPDDFRTWIIARSPYIQNVTTFGTGAIGQKIDGDLHAGGNDSIVSNDFTQVISDGIGAWVLNNGRAELVSVFTYYAHIGYLSEAGGRIRGTNGNNSYGDFGSVGEGYDVRETPNSATVDNKLQFEATVGAVFTDGEAQVLAFEFENAGNDYTEVNWTVNGSGSNATVEGNEFRDDGVFNVRLLDNVDDSTDAPEADGNFGGFGYISNANTCQGGTTTNITIAATDGELSTAYVGMKVYLTGGTGAGQFGIIATYNAGTKLATVTKESTGAAGWDHIIPGRTISAPDASTTYVIEPRVAFSAPTYSTTAKTLPSATWVDASWTETIKTYLDISGTTSGSGVSATFDITLKGARPSVILKTAGTGYVRLDTITILGTSLGGTSTTNDLTITVTSVNSVTGAIQAFDTAGFASSGRFIALATGTSNVATSEDGDTWTSRSAVLPASTTWTAVASGKLTAIETAGAFVVGRSYTILSFANTPWTAIGSTSNLDGTTFIATGVGTGTGTARPNASITVAVASGGTQSAYSLDGGLTWTNGGALTSSGTWSAVGYGNGYFVAVRSGSTAASRTVNGGLSWSTGGALPSSSPWTGVAYGGGVWVAIASDGTAAYSTNNGGTWASVSMPSANSWTSVTWGNNRFVAVCNTSGTESAYSFDGITWTASTLPATASWTSVRYGAGTFLAVSQSTAAATSPDGINWTSRTTSTAAAGFSQAVFGNPNQIGTWAAVQRSTAGTVASLIKAGATAKGRAYVSQNKIYAVYITEPGSGYASAPTITITDPSNIYDAPTTVRIGKGVLANPSFTNRGIGYISASADLDTGNGYGNFFQDGNYIAVRRLTQRPVAGSNVVFSHLPNETFKLVNVLTFLGDYDGSYTAFFQISPEMKKINAPDEGTTLETRIRYSQVRLTGHDFLDIGTGSFSDTNYPGIPNQDPIPANETVENNGGRVFYTSTDQDGNFRVGGLFNIEQSTGVATLNADAFNIAGLQELTLGNLALGGGSATINEFSTDPFFTANSDNIVPTQRAIKAYIAAQIGGGGASLNVNSVTAGYIYVAGSEISTTTGGQIAMKANFEFRGGVTGLPVAWNYFLT